LKQDDVRTSPIDNHSPPLPQAHTSLPLHRRRTHHDSLPPSRKASRKRSLAQVRRRSRTSKGASPSSRRATCRSQMKPDFQLAPY
jgi:hypothetical protein